MARRLEAVGDDADHYDGGGGRHFSKAAWTGLGSWGRVRHRSKTWNVADGPVALCRPTTWAPVEWSWMMVSWFAARCLPELLHHMQPSLQPVGDDDRRWFAWEPKRRKTRAKGKRRINGDERDVVRCSERLVEDNIRVMCCEIEERLGDRPSPKSRPAPRQQCSVFAFGVELEADGWVQRALGVLSLGGQGCGG